MVACLSGCRARGKRLSVGDVLLAAMGLIKHLQPAVGGRLLVATGRSFSKTVTVCVIV